MQNFLPRIVGKADVFHLYPPVHAIELHRPARLFIFQLLVQNFARALEAGNGLGDLRADGHDLKDGRNQQAQKNVERKKSPQRHRARKNLVRAELHDDCAYDAHQTRGGKTHQRSGRERLQNIVQQALHAAGEDPLLTLFGVVTLHHANAAERLGKASRDFRVNFRPCAENRPNRRKRFVDPVPEDQQDAERDAGHGHAGMN